MPEFNYLFSGMLKNAIEWASRVVSHLSLQTFTAHLQQQRFLLQHESREPVSA